MNEVEAAVGEADPTGPMFNEIAQELHGPFTKQVAGVPGVSTTFATEVLCHPLLLGLADALVAIRIAEHELPIS